MVSVTFSSFALLLSKVFLFSQLVFGATTYWVDPTCSNYGDLADSVTEAIWNAGKLAASLEQRDSRWEQALKWFFNFDYSTFDSVGLPKVDNVQYTFDRIGKLTPGPSRLGSVIRIYCDNDRRYRAVDNDGHYLASNPDPEDPSFKTTLFYDVNNDSLILGSGLSCLRSENPDGVVYAHTVEFLNERYNAFRSTVFPQPSTDLANRVTITICDALHNGQNPSSTFTWKGLAQKDMRPVTNIPGLSINAAQIITHELAHCRVNSEQTIFEPSGTDSAGNGATIQQYLECGVDYHPNRIREGISTGARGYYYLDDALTPGERLDKWEWTIMNPDSYAYMATLYRLYGKRWNHRRDAGTGLITMYPDPTLPDTGDWPSL